MLSLLQERECSLTLPRKRFYTQVSGPNSGIAGRLQRRAATLEGHEGCVNTISFTNDGDTLISGSDDRSIVMWDWQKGDPRLHALRKLAHSTACWNSRDDALDQLRFSA